MRYSLGLLGLAALATASDVHDLTKDTFGPFVQENGLVLAEFFAPWCGHCKALAPEYEEAATSLKEKDIQLAKIDCTVETDLCSSFGVEGYPTLKVFRGSDNHQPYTGPRKAQAIVSYMTKQSLPSVSLLTSSTALDDFKTSDKVVVVGFFGADDAASNATFGEIADTLRDSYLFGATSDAGLAEAEGVLQPGVVVYKSFDEGKNVHEGAFTAEDITAFTKTASIPLIGEVGPETYAGYMAAGIPLAYIFSATADERETLSKALRPVAEKYKGKVNFATIDAEAFGQHAQNLNLETGNWPAFAIQDTVNGQKYPYSEAGKVSALSEKKIGKFLEEFVNGKIEPSIKSEPIPEKQEGPVTVVVAKSYRDVVIDNDKDVLLEFYAPWCGHCKALSPKYDELAALFAERSDKVVIAKIDATANDVPDEIRGYPTIKLFKAGEKGSPITYSGPREVEALANYVRENGSHHVDPYADAMDVDGTDVIDTATMVNQAPAATAASAASAATEGAKGGIASAVSAAAEVVKTALADNDGDTAAHDEL